MLKDDVICRGQISMTIPNVIKIKWDLKLDGFLLYVQYIGVVVESCPV